MRLEKDKNMDYWRDITVIVEDELHKLRKLDTVDSQTGRYDYSIEFSKYLYGLKYNLQLSKYCTTIFCIL